jgi:hypothetical protein
MTLQRGSSPDRLHLPQRAIPPGQHRAQSLPQFVNAVRSSCSTTTSLLISRSVGSCNSTYSERVSDTRAHVLDVKGDSGVATLTVRGLVFVSDTAAVGAVRPDTHWALPCRYASSCG